ncbi:MAG: LPS-assembly lipoprotein [Pseudohongiellaceae bacterium]|jgi:LPS-assembly lipoprotein
MRNLLFNLVISTCLLSLSGCGFTLRGNDSFTAQLTNLQLSLEQPNSEFSRLLRSNLDAAGVTINLIESIGTAESESDIALLLITDEQVVSRPVTVNARARAAQYELRMSITIALGQSARYLIEPESLVVQRIYFEDIENISGNREEVEIISAEMRRELVNQLMRRLQATEI